MSTQRHLRLGASLAWCLAAGLSLPLGACLPSARSTVQPPVVEQVRIFDGKLGTAPDMGVAAQAAAAAASGSKRGLTHGNVSGVWRLSYPDPEGQQIRVQEIWRLVDDGQSVSGTRRYDPSFDPALASTRERKVMGTWGLGGQGVWAVGLVDGMGSLVLVGEKTLNHHSATTGKLPAQGIWLATYSPDAPLPDPLGSPSPGPFPSLGPSPGLVSNPKPEAAASPAAQASPTPEPAASEPAATP